MNKRIKIKHRREAMKREKRSKDHKDFLAAKHNAQQKPVLQAVARSAFSSSRPNTPDTNNVGSQDVFKKPKSFREAWGING